MTAPETRSLAAVLDDHALLRTAWRAGTAAASFLRDERPTMLEVDTKSSPTDSVTVMDRGAESLIFSSLLAERPGDATLGEEGGERPGTTGVRWIVDPLDGTVNYLYGLPVWGVSVAAEVEGRTTVGVVLLPEIGEAFVGVLGGGAWRVVHDEARRMRVVDRSRLSEALVSTGFGYSAERRRAQGAVVADLLPYVRDIRRSGCVVADLCWLAMGRVDAHYERGLNPWDVAAAGLIAAEAGAIVTGLTNADLTDVLVASSPGIAEDLRGHLVRLRADQG